MPAKKGTPQETAPVIPTLPAVQTAQLPANWEEAMAAEARAAAAEEPLSGRFLSLKGGVLSFNGEQLKDNKMKVVVLDSVIEQAYFPGVYDPNAPATPDCYAFAREHALLKPHDMVANKQSDRCATCKQNQWGSAGKGKACKEKRRLLLIDAQILAQGATTIAAAEPVSLSVPVMSVKNWASYVTQLANLIKRPPYAVVTEVSVAPDPRSMFAVRFMLVEAIGAELLPYIKMRRESVADQLMKPYVASDGKPAVPAPTPQQRAVAQVETAARQAGRKF